MLLRFVVGNHRSIDEPIELSLVAVDGDRPAAREVRGVKEKVLTVAAIYGPNASGKSNVLDAIGWLSSAVGESLRQWEADAIPQDPFRLGILPGQPTTFEVEFVAADTRYLYRLDVTNERVEHEALYSYPEGRARKLFERELDDLASGKSVASFAGIRDLLTPSTLVLTAGLRLSHPALAEAANFLRSLTVLGLNRWAFQRVSPTATMRWFDPNYVPAQPSPFPEFDEEARLSDREAALDLLRYADLGIGDVEIVEEQRPDTGEGDGAVRRPRRRPRLLHSTATSPVAFEIRDESLGTQTWFNLIGPMLSVLRQGNVLVLDELDASLHPKLSAKIIEMFQDPESNRRNAQLIFTTHDTGLLNHLNRDEVWLTEKVDGATSLTGLAEFGGDRVRVTTNLERAYLQGRFGALPSLDQRILRRAIGADEGAR